MRTLKKSLCLILALVFVLGLCTIGAGAAFTDDAEINYDDAVTVMNGLGILTGYEDGSFKPGNNVTRAEAAAMITRMMLGPENADKLPLGDVKFSDVPDTNWAAKYISFCANKGIIVGMGDGTFHPDDPVTGTQLATMLLRAAGYGTMGEYEGKGWDINAVADALYYKIFEDTEVTNFDQAASREECALYVFNTLTKVDQVKWDVDINRYEKYDDPFGESVFHLLTRQNIGYVTVLANQATGEDYTIVRQTWTERVETTREGRTYTEYVLRNYDMKLDYKTGLDLIGHEVEVFIDGNSKENAKHEYYYETYLIEDASTVLDKGTYYNDFYRNAVNANRANANVKFTDIDVWYNYDYQNAFNGKAGAVYDTDYEPKVEYKTIAELKGQRSSRDKSAGIGGFGSTIVLDHEGKILRALSSTWTVGRVASIDEYGIDIKNSYGTTNYDFKDIASYYDGIKKNDYAVVMTQGKLYTILPTTTTTVEISQIDSSRTSFNNGAYSADPFGYLDMFGGFLVPIPEADSADGVHVGDTVRFFISIANFYFGLSIEDPAQMDGVVFINYANKIEPTGYDKYGDENTVPTYIVQAVTEDGTVKDYKVSEDTYNELTNDGKNKKQLGVFKAYTKASGLTTFKTWDDERFASYFDEAGNHKNFLKRDGGTYVISGDTKVCYLNGKTGSGLKVTTAKTLASGDYSVFATYRQSGGSYKLRAVWVFNVKAPEDFEESFVYICDENAEPVGYKGFGKSNAETPYYSLLIDGTYVDDCFIKADEACYEDGEVLKGGFYRYNINDDGEYVLTAYTSKVQKDVLYKGAVRNGKLYADYADGLTIKAVIYDVSGDTTVKTQRDVEVLSAERLEELLDDGYIVTMEYVYKTSGGNRVPQGCIYVIDVVRPDA